VAASFLASQQDASSDGAANKAADKMSSRQSCGDAAEGAAASAEAAKEAAEKAAAEAAEKEAAEKAAAEAAGGAAEESAAADAAEGAVEMAADAEADAAKAANPRGGAAAAAATATSSLASEQDASSDGAALPKMNVVADEADSNDALSTAAIEDKTVREGEVAVSIAIDCKHRDGFREETDANGRETLVCDECGMRIKAGPALQITERFVEAAKVSVANSKGASDAAAGVEKAPKESKKKRKNFKDNTRDGAAAVASSLASQQDASSDGAANETVNKMSSRQSCGDAAEGAAKKAAAEACEPAWVAAGRAAEKAAATGEEAAERAAELLHAPSVDEILKKLNKNKKFGRRLARQLRGLQRPDGARLAQAIIDGMAISRAQEPPKKENADDSLTQGGSQKANDTELHFDWEAFAEKGRAEEKLNEAAFVEESAMAIEEALDKAAAVMFSECPEESGRARLLEENAEKDRAGRTAAWREAAAVSGLFEPDPRRLFGAPARQWLGSGSGFFGATAGHGLFEAAAGREGELSRLKATMDAHLAAVGMARVAREVADKKVSATVNTLMDAEEAEEKAAITVALLAYEEAKVERNIATRTMEEKQRSFIELCAQSAPVHHEFFAERSF
jgi:hypothetical protein